jgi:hypothetical protein
VWLVPFIVLAGALVGLIARGAGARRLAIFAWSAGAVFVASFAGAASLYDCYNADCGGADDVEEVGIYLGASGLIVSAVLAGAARLRR